MGRERDGGVAEVDHAAEAVAGEGQDAGGGFVVPGEAAFAEGGVGAANAESGFVEVEMAVGVVGLGLGGQS